MRKWVSAILVMALALALFAIPGSATSVHKFTVVFKSDRLPANAAEIIAAAGGEVVSAVPEIGMMTVTGPVNLLNTLGSNAAIQAISPTLDVKLAPAAQVEFTEQPSTADPSTADRWALQWDVQQMTNNGASYALDSGSHNTVVGIIDTGVRTTHTALVNNLVGGCNFVPDGPDGTVVANDIEDKNGHGTHVAGSIAGNGRILGVAPEMAFKSYRVFGASGSTSSDIIINAIVYAATDGVDVITMSIGGYDAMAGYTYTDPETGLVSKGKDVADFLAYRRAVRYAIQNGVVVVAAAGNEAINTSNPKQVTEFLNETYGADGYYFWGASREVPGTLPGVVCVSATGPDYSLASYSNYGMSSIDITAPGGDFQRYPAPDYYTDMCLSTYRSSDTSYAWMAGTSMATPKVAAVAALIVDQAKAKGIALTPAQVVRLLEQSAIDIGGKGNDIYFGHGFASAYAALGGK